MSKYTNLILNVSCGCDLCETCNGSGKADVSFKYDISDKTKICHNILKQIAKITNGEPCDDCEGNGLIQVYSNYDASVARHRFDIFIDSIIPKGKPLLFELANDSKHELKWEM